MKINIEIDCTPEEARAFLGLPDVAPIQKVLMEEMQRRMVDAVQTSDPKQLLEQWVPMGFKALEQWPAIWTQLAAAAANFPPKAPGKPKKE